MISAMGKSPTGTKGFGKTFVNGRNREPFPPAKMTACILDIINLRFKHAGVVLDPLAGLHKALFQGNARVPPAHVLQLTHIATEPFHLALGGTQTLFVLPDFDILFEGLRNKADKVAYGNFP